MIDEADARLFALLAADGYEPGGAQSSYDKQFVRDYLETFVEQAAARACAARRSRASTRAPSTWRPIGV